MQPPSVEPPIVPPVSSPMAVEGAPKGHGEDNGGPANLPVLEPAAPAPFDASELLVATGPAAPPDPSPTAAATGRVGPRRRVVAAAGNVSPPIATGTGVPCRVCGKDDGEDRAQADLHVRCIEKAAKAARARAHPPGRRLTRATLVARLAAERDTTRSSRARATAAQVDPDELDHQEPAELEDLREDLGPGALSTEGLG